MPLLSNTLRDEYRKLFDSCAINLTRLDQIDLIVSDINLPPNKAIYTEIQDATGVPWFFTAILHNMESDRNFKRHLHNGDPLTARTVQVPAGRPVAGIPPFSFTVSAIDALRHKKFHTHTSWDLPQILYRFEKYNGFAYRNKHNIASPYLWSGCNHYSKGKYVADHVWDATAVSRQIGAAVVLRRMAEKEIIKIQDETLPARDYAKLVVFDPGHYNQYAEELQKFLNSFPGIYLLPDGKAGRKTSDAFKKVFGIYLKGDPLMNS